MIRNLRWAGVVLAVMLSWVASTATAQEYEIRLHRPLKVGQKYGVSTTAHLSRSMTITAEKGLFGGQNEEFSVELECVVTVLEIDDKGRETKVSMAISKCVKIKGENKKDLVPKDAVVVASQKGRKEQVFTIGEEPLGAEAQEALGSVVSLSKGGATDDEILGTKDRKKVGDRWNINAAAAAKNLETEMPGIQEKNITGTTTLEGVVKVGGIECLKIAAEMTIEIPPIEGEVAAAMPEGLKVSKSTVEMRCVGVFPVDASMDRLEESIDEKVTLITELSPDPDTPGMVMQTIAQSRQTTKVTPME